MDRLLRRSGYLLLLYALLLFAGGCAGFIVKRSLPSLLAGSVSGAGALWISTLLLTKRKSGLYAGGVLLFLLGALFFRRFMATQCFIPAGLMMFITVAVFIPFLFGVIRSLGRKRAS
ncbi:MAG: hypothetical protein OXF02_06895 [Simkaniaceae bacterium]|nr:hypothetical protein [Simkaniaceae bacterium]